MRDLSPHRIEIDRQDGVRAAVEIYFDDGMSPQEVCLDVRDLCNDRALVFLDSDTARRLAALLVFFADHMESLS